MRRLFLDTNILLDFAGKRMPFYTAANDIFTLAGRGEVGLYVSALSFATLAYVRRRDPPVEVKRALRDALVLTDVAALNKAQLWKAAAPDSPFPDTEDAMQHAAALEARCEIILTRDLDDFKPSSIPVMTADDFLARRAAGTLL